MFPDLNNFSIYIVPGYVDMRKQITGLSSVLYDTTEINLQEPNIFIFCGKTKKILKALYWDKNGFCLWQKKLCKDRFPWPNTEGEIELLDLDKLTLLLKGIDFWRAHKPMGTIDFF